MIEVVQRVEGPTGMEVLAVRSCVSVLFLFVFVSWLGFAGAVEVEVAWDRSDYGIVEHDVWVRCMMDGGEGWYILAGEANSGIASADSYLAKIDGEGNVLWQDTYGRRGPDLRMICEGVRDLARAEDGGFVAVSSANCPVSSADSKSYCEGCVFKVDGGGNKVWDRVYGDVRDLFCVTPTVDGGFLLGGLKEVPCLLKIDSRGEKVWERSPDLRKKPYLYSFPGSGFHGITESGDGGYVLCGASASEIIFVLKVDSEGNRVWLYLSRPGEGYVSEVVRNGEGFLALGEQLDDGSLYLLGLGGDGNKTWERVYSSVEGHGIASVGDGLLIVGKKDHEPYLLKIDGHGNEMWSMKIPECDNGLGLCLDCHLHELDDVARVGEDEYIVAHKDCVAKIRIGPNAPVPETPVNGIWPICLIATLIIYRSDHFPYRNPVWQGSWT